MNHLSKSNLYRYTGDISQIIYAKQYRFCGGKADGMRAVEISNGTGLQFTVLPDRAMDIGNLSFQGVNYSYISKAGFVSPAYFDNKTGAWNSAFTAGFLTTCGLTQVGSPCECDGEKLGQHGELSGVPAEEFHAEVNLDKDIPEIIARGKMRLASLFGYNLWMTREIRAVCGDNKIYIRDTVENRGEAPCPYMILYHFNIGYPLLDKDTILNTNAQFIRSRDQEAEKGESERLKFSEPQPGFKEQVYYYKSMPDETGRSFAGVFNEKNHMGLKIWVDPTQLPNFIQWKNSGFGDYVLGIEPANCYPEGRLKQKQYGLEYLDSLEVRQQDICIEAYKKSEDVKNEGHA